MKVKFIFLTLVSVILTPCNRADQVVEYFHVRSDIWYRFSTTWISSVVRNVDSSAQVIRFDPTLPKEAFIVAFHMDIDGTRYDGHVEKRFLVPAVNHATPIRNQGLRYPRHATRHTNIFEVSVVVSAGGAANFTLTYQQLLRRRMGFYDYGLYISPGQPVEDLRVEVEIHENRPLTFVRTPALKTDSVYSDLLSHFDSVNLNELTTINRLSPKSARVVFQPSIDQQGGGSGNGLSAMFSVQYDLEYGGLTGDVLVSDGYFVHFITPPKEQRSLPKDIVFVLDESGSMTCRKWQQVNHVMTAILSQLKPEDCFNIIMFSSLSHKWRNRLAKVDNDTVQHAISFVQSKIPFGRTNINSALLTALSQFKLERPGKRVKMILFLTDGLPTEGESDIMKIAQNVLNANKKRVAIFSLAFGEDADYSSLRTLSAQNFGFATKIHEGPDAAQQVYSLYEDISSISIKGLNVNYRKGTVDEFSLTQSNFPIVFDGTEIMISGQLEVGAKILKYEFAGIVSYGHLNISAELRTGDLFVVSPERTSEQLLFLKPGDNTSLLERMWAYETIQQLMILKEKHVDDREKTEELEEKVSALSLKYQFVSAPTSMVVAQPDHKVTEVRKLDLPSSARDPEGTITSMSLRLVTLTLKEGANTSKSICMVPKHLIYGNIVLLSGPKTEVVLKQCERKLCPGQPSLEGLELTSGSKSTEVFLDYSGRYVYSSIPYNSPAFVVTSVSYTVLQVSGSGLTCVLDWTPQQGQAAGYRIRLTVDETIPHDKLFSDLEVQPGSGLTELTREATEEARRVCGGESTDVITVVFDKRAKAYSVYRLSRGKRDTP